MLLLIHRVAPGSRWRTHLLNPTHNSLSLAQFVWPCRARSLIGWKCGRLWVNTPRERRLHCAGDAICRRDRWNALSTIAITDVHYPLFCGPHWNDAFANGRWERLPYIASVGWRYLKTALYFVALWYTEDCIFHRYFIAFTNLRLRLNDYCYYCCYCYWQALLSCSSLSISMVYSVCGSWVLISLESWKSTRLPVGRSGLVVWQMICQGTWLTSALFWFGQDRGIIWQQSASELVGCSVVCQLVMAKLLQWRLSS